MPDDDKIRDLFDPSRKIDRDIEKVISYLNEAKLLAEISEYVVTKNIEENFFDLLTKMSLAMSGPGGAGQGGNEIGVWVSGFYGSGKSSFTKYLGFALDRTKKLGDRPFLHHLQDQLQNFTTKALFNTVANQLDPHVVFLDLASEMTAGGGMEDVSTVLRNKVLRDAGYANDLKVIELELMLERDGKIDDFKKAAREELKGASWDSIHNKPLLTNTVGARLAVKFYPHIWKTAEEFANIRIDSTANEADCVKEMIELVKRKSGKKNIIFIVDEVGQYVAARSSLIQNLDGFVKNLKVLGEGSVWLFATAQQTLTEDNRSATFNSPDLYKLKDRFPITVHLESNDIKEICHKRLLNKSPGGNNALDQLFQGHGASLRTATQLRNAPNFEFPLDSALFRDLYPFLPSHFEILLQLLGKLARRTGGLGLRSAIKVLQDVLVDKSKPRGDGSTLADMRVGTLANTVTFYDSLEREIDNSYPEISSGVKRVLDLFGKRPEPFTGVAKTIAVLQILETLPATIDNIAALIYPRLATPGLTDMVEAIVLELLKSESMVPLGEKDGRITFLSRAAIELQVVFDKIEVKAAEKRARVHDAIKNLFTPLPNVRVADSLGVQAGLRVTQGGGSHAVLDGEKQTLHWLVDLVDPAQYETISLNRVQESRTPTNNHTLFVLARLHQDLDAAALTAARCSRFINERSSSADPDVKDFIKTVLNKLDRANSELIRLIRDEFLKGSFIYVGVREPICNNDQPFDKGCKEFLATVAQKVYDRYSEAPMTASTDLAEKFLKASLNHQTTTTDPMGLVQKKNGLPPIRTDVKALISIVDYLTNHENEAEGRVLLDHFSEPPFGWSKDTTRYLVAALLTAGVIKIRIAGADHLISSDEACKALSSNKLLGPVAIQLRDARPDPVQLLQAMNRLIELTGQQVLPLEEDIGKAARKFLPQFQLDYAGLPSQLQEFQLLLDARHGKRAADLASDLAAVLQGDGTDAIQRFGKKESPLFDSLVWARVLTKALADGLATTLRRLIAIKTEWKAVPRDTTTEQAHSQTEETNTKITQLLAEDDFQKNWQALQACTTELETRLKEAKDAMIAKHNLDVNNQLNLRYNEPDYMNLTEADRTEITGIAAAAVLPAHTNTKPISELINDLYKAGTIPGTVANRIRAKIGEYNKKRDEEVTLPKVDHPIDIPAYITSKEQITPVVKKLEELRDQIDSTKAVRIVWKTKITEQGT